MSCDPPDPEVIKLLLLIDEKLKWERRIRIALTKHHREYYERKLAEIEAEIKKLDFEDGYKDRMCTIKREIEQFANED